MRVVVWGVIRLGAQVLFLACWLWPNMVSARIIILSPEMEPAGETGALLAGAQTAFSAGGEGFFSNPAGLARDSRPQTTAGMDLLQYQSLQVGGSRQGGFAAPGVFFGLSDGVSTWGSSFRTTYGVSLRREPAAVAPFNLRDSHQGPAGELPAGLVDPVRVDELFPEGLSVMERSTGESRLDRMSLGLGLAFELQSVFRLGVQALLEWVDLAASGRTALAYAGKTVSASSETTLSGTSWNGVSLTGHSTRVIWQLGIQTTLVPGVELGVMTRLPSDTLRGSGSVSLHQAHQLQVETTTGGTPEIVMDRAGSITIQGDGLEFHLESPRELRMGLSFKSDWMLLSLELARVAPQAPYSVFPGLVGTNTLTGAARLPSLRTSGKGGASMGLGVVFLHNSNTAFLLGWRSDRSPVPEEDPLFIKLNQNTLSLGWYRTEGRTTAGLGVLYREGTREGVRLPTLQGFAEPPVVTSVRREAWRVHLGTTRIF